MNVSINPSYFCNLRCSFCYLGDQLGDRKRAEISAIAGRLKEIVAYEPIERIDLYGGEVTFLPQDYLDALFTEIKRFYSGQVNVITNLTRLHPMLERDDVDVSVSFDFECRSGYEKTLLNMMLLGKPIAVLMLASRCLIEKDIAEMVAVLNGVTNITSVEVKPYSTNQYNQHSVSFKDFEVFVRKLICANPALRPTLINTLNIKDSISGRRNAFSDDHIYITPGGSFAVLDFDADDNEYFNELPSFSKYIEWRQHEKMRVQANKYCSNCKYFGKCLTEHYRDVVTLENSCNGFKGLLDWYEETQISTASLSQDVYD